jgi:hypothetical protein
MKKFVMTMTAVAALGVGALAQQDQKPRPLSPRGSAEAHVGVEISKTGTRSAIKGGNWVEISYGRPLKRGRPIWGGDSFGKDLYAGAPVWRAGSDVATLLKTEVPLTIGGKTLPAGSHYTMFIEFKSATDWTLIISSYGAKTTGKDPAPDTLWGSYGYTPEKDMVRASMTVTKLPVKLEQLTWAFTDMTNDGGKITLMWDDVAASVPFTVGK